MCVISGNQTIAGFAYDANGAAVVELTPPVVSNGIPRPHQSTSLVEADLAIRADELGSVPDGRPSDYATTMDVLNQKQHHSMDLEQWPAERGNQGYGPRYWQLRAATIINTYDDERDNAGTLSQLLRKVYGVAHHPNLRRFSVIHRGRGVGCVLVDSAWLCSLCAKLHRKGFTYGVSKASLDGQGSGFHVDSSAQQRRVVGTGTSRPVRAAHAAREYS